jgi:hypothetical protein
MRGNFRCAASNTRILHPREPAVSRLPVANHEAVRAILIGVFRNARWRNHCASLFPHGFHTVLTPIRRSSTLRLYNIHTPSFVYIHRWMARSHARALGLRSIHGREPRAMTSTMEKLSQDGGRLFWGEHEGSGDLRQRRDHAAKRDLAFRPVRVAAENIAGYSGGGVWCHRP